MRFRVVAALAALIASTASVAAVPELSAVASEVVARIDLLGAEQSSLGLFLLGLAGLAIGRRSSRTRSDVRKGDA